MPPRKTSGGTGPTGIGLTGSGAVPAAEDAEDPHYHGHRERLRERFLTAGPESLSDYEMV
ncbi:MAG: repair protein RadC, partial [Bradyrhizobium sp.]